MAQLLKPFPRFTNISLYRNNVRDVSNGDIPSVFVASYTYELPFGNTRQIRLFGFLDKLLGGWDMTGVLTLQSGIPIAVTQATNFNAFAGFGTQRPNQVADASLPSDQRGVERWFNTEAFATAPQFSLAAARAIRYAVRITETSMLP